jgi:drug/metabolite transporter (DMT)-like permease
MWAAFLTTILYSFSALFAQRTARVMGGITANFWRLVLATLFLGLWSHLAGIGLRGPALPWFFVSGVVGFGVGDVALYQAYPRLGSRLVIMVVHCLATPTAALIEFLWLGASLTPTQVFCILVSLSGVAVAVAPSGDGPRRHPQFLLGLGFGLVAMLGQALGAVLTRKANSVGIAAGGPLPDGINAAYQRVWGGLLVALATYVLFHLRRRLRGRASSPVEPSADPADTPPRRRVLLWVLCNTLAGPVLGVSCFQWALRGNPTGVVLPIVALTPLMIIPVAHWMEGERTTRREILGGAVAVAGVALLARITHPV